jgi:hypothetical protein
MPIMNCVGHSKEYDNKDSKFGNLCGEKYSKNSNAHVVSQEHVIANSQTTT